MGTAKRIGFMEDLQSAGSVKQQIAKLFEESLRTTVPDEGDVEPAIAPCQNPKFGDYQCNNAMGLWSRVKGKGTQFKGPQLVGQSIQKMLVHTIETWASEIPVKRAVVDFSSPNIAKEMHVGNLRSTIIGDTLARMLEFSKVEVLRRNHVGDWGTQAFYKASKQRFDSDPAFKERAQRAVVSLQGESFYNPYIPRVVELLNEKGLIEESEGARVIFIKGKKIPLIVVKKDGGYNYASTDLAALWYRLYEEKAEWIIYVTDVGQREHFEMVFTAAKQAGWLPAEDNKYPKASHVGFGLVLGEDGKRFRTRSTETVKLVDLLDEAKNRCREALVQRGKSEEWTAEELDKTAEAVGYGAVKYADLKNNRSTNYTFSFDQMLNDKIGTMELDHPDERVLGLHLLQFLEVVGSAEETSRLLLCEATAIVMRKCFYLLGITPVYKI
ncbi:UNVERIFIED_CONTAM: Arginine--tRNA ligase, chloroplastic/mitochondrial [Sesamum indicum]